LPYFEVNEIRVALPGAAPAEVVEDVIAVGRRAEWQTQLNTIAGGASMLIARSARTPACGQNPS